MVEKLNFALLGCGLFGVNNILPAFLHTEHSNLIALTKRDGASAKKIADAFGVPKAYSDNDRKEMLNAEIDAVYIATPNAMHMKDTIEALEAGKHVIVEKPMAMNVDECFQMMDKEKETGCQIMIAHCMRFTNVIHYFNEIIASEKIGKLVLVTSDFLSRGKDSKRPWKFVKDIAGGGAAFDLGSHMVDTIRYISQSPVENIQVTRIPKDLKPEEMDLVSNFLLRFENSVVGRATSSYLGPRKTFLEVYGETGFLRAYDWNLYNRDIKIVQEIAGKYEEKTVYNSDYYAEMIDKFSQAILNHTKIPVPSSEGLENQKIIDLVNKT